jgi:hypothetical protein
MTGVHRRRCQGEVRAVTVKRLATMPELKQSLSDRYRVRGSDIEKKVGSLQRFTPEAGRQLGLIQHVSDTFCRGAILALSHAVLLGCSSHCVLSLDPLSLHESVPLITNELATLVVMQTDDLLACLLLHKLFVSLERSQGLALLAK